MPAKGCYRPASTLACKSALACRLQHARRNSTQLAPGSQLSTAAHRLCQQPRLKAHEASQHHVCDMVRHGVTRKEQMSIIDWSDTRPAKAGASE